MSRCLMMSTYYMYMYFEVAVWSIRDDDICRQAEICL